MRPSTVTAPPMQNGPLFFSGQARHAEEQLAFHEKYHDRMARITGGLGGMDAAVSGHNGLHLDSCVRSSDYWAEYAKRLEQMGVSRSSDDTFQRKATLPMASTPQRSNPDSSRVLPCPLSRQWETHSSRKSPAQMLDESVLQRLDWLAQEKSEPDTSDVIDLLREVEDVLVSEENRKHDEPNVSVPFQPNGPSSSGWLGASRALGPGRSAGAPSAPLSSFPSNFAMGARPATYHHNTAPPPPPATTPTAAPSFQHMTQGTTSNSLPGAADWSRMSNHQKMEWYRVYYAWMMYYAQYYGAILASQRQQQLLQPQPQPQQKMTRKNTDKHKTSLKELSKESKELAEEVERLKHNFWNHVSAKKSAPFSSAAAGNVHNKQRQQRFPTPRAEDEEDTLYRSDNGYSYLCANPTPALPSSKPITASSKSRRLSKAVLRGESLNDRRRLANSTSVLNAAEGDSDTVHSQRPDLPWLPPREQVSDQVQGRTTRPATARDISWLYKYEEKDTEEKSQTGSTEEGTELHHQDSARQSDFQESEMEKESANFRSNRHGAQVQPRHQERRLSVYERRKRELEQENPRWRF